MNSQNSPILAVENESGSGTNPTTSSSTTVNDSLVSAVECPVCFDVSLPILQCKNGHILCQSCSNSLSSRRCPTCRVSCSESIRNLALEKLVKNPELRIACKNAGNGCKQKMFFVEKMAHQEECSFNSYACPLSPRTCRWNGRLDDIVAHLAGRNRSCHSIRVSYAAIAETSTFFFDAEPPEADFDFDMSIQIQSCIGVNTSFIVAFSIQTTLNELQDVEEDSDSAGNYSVERLVAVREYSALVQCIGTSDVASQYAYRMELELDGRRLSWEAVPLSIGDGIRTAMKKGDCLQFGRKTMELFKTSAFTLPIYVTITKKE